MKKEKNNIEDKPTLPKKEEDPPFKVELSNKTIDKVIEEVEANTVRPTTDSNKVELPKSAQHWNEMKDEHPKLASMYGELNDLLNVAGRSSELRRQRETEIFNQRAFIREYEIKNGITRADHLRWAGF